MDIEHVPIARLAEMAAPYNPRTISASDLESLRRSLRFFGPVEPVVVNKRSSHVVGGHQRIKAASAEGIEELPVYYVDLDEPSEKQLNLALNRISGEWDDAALRALLLGLEESGADLELTGFNDTELENLLNDPAGSPNEEWDQAGMPGFENPGAMAFRSITVHIADQEALEEFGRLLDMKVDTARYLFFPADSKKTDTVADLVWAAKKAAS